MRLIQLIVILILLSLSAGPVFAVQEVGKNSRVWGSEFNSDVCDKTKPKIVDAHMFVFNATDPVLAPAWMSDKSIRFIQIWDEGDGTYCVMVLHEGVFGAESVGKFMGGFVVKVTGKALLASSRWLSKGYIGNVDYECDFSGRCAGEDRANLFTAYFDEGSTFSYLGWVWVYTSNSNLYGEL